MKKTIRLFPVYNVNIIVTTINYVYLCKSKYLYMKDPPILLFLIVRIVQYIVSVVKQSHCSHRFITFGSS